jgi:hypothetical protein
VKIQERERVCLELLRKLPQKFVLIGGYAASSFDFPRFSVDLDLVIRGKDVELFSGILKGEGFRLVKDLGDFSKFYKGRIMKFEKKADVLPVSADLFMDMIQARQTDAAYSFEYLWKNSEIRKVVGIGVKDYVEARVANREMLIALKINSMRRADQRDIISLCNGSIIVTKVLNHLKRVDKGKILNHFDILVATLEKPESKDSIKGVFGISDQVYKRMIDKAKKGDAFYKKGHLHGIKYV